jgi:hypothetical protein
VQSLGSGRLFEREKEHERHEGAGIRLAWISNPGRTRRLTKNPAGATLVLVEVGKYNNEIQDLSNSVNPSD